MILRLKGMMNEICLTISDKKKPTRTQTYFGV